MRRLLPMIVMLCTAITGGAQLHIFPTPAPGDSIIVSLLTCAPGTEVYQLEGHTALRIAYGNVDMVANWGVFDFDSPGFVYRFCKGETDYMVAAYPTALFLAGYRQEGRRVTASVLNLNRAQALEVIRRVDENLLPQNRVYRYNYVLDNCATRPVAIIESATGDSITFPATYTAYSSKPTFRSVMQHFHRNYPWYQFGIDLALGPGIDKPISPRGTIFAPVVLGAIADKATLGNAPLVRETRILVEGTPRGTGATPTPWYLTPMAVSCFLLLFTIAIIATGSRRQRLFKGWYTALFTLAGIGGCIITFLIIISVHEATSPNILIFWLNPLCLCVPAFIFFSRGRRWLIPYMWANIMLCLIPPIGAVLGYQMLNGAFYPLILSDILLSLYFLYHSRETSI